MKSEFVENRNTVMIPPQIKRGLPRLVEAAAAFVGLILCLPLLAFGALAIVLTSRGPVFFAQRRMGRGGQLFTIYKLRTMRETRGGAQVTAEGDRRVTAVGRILRKTKLDEIPELWNVLRGDMSLVGPRPEVPQYVDLNEPLWRAVLGARPGITDPVTMRLRNEESLLAEVKGEHERFYVEMLQPFKLRGYLDYLFKRTAWSDFKVLLKTAIAVVLPIEEPPPTVEEIITNSVNSRAAIRSDEGRHMEGATHATSGARQRHLWWTPLMTKQVQLLLDLLVLVAAFALAYLLRFDFDIPAREVRNALMQFPYVVLMQFALLIVAGVYAFVWRYTGMAEAKRILAAVLWSMLPLIILRVSLPDSFAGWRVPYSVIVINAIIAFGGVLGLRLLRRALYERYEKRRKTALFGNEHNRKRVLLVGAGHAGMLAAGEMQKRGDMNLNIIGFVDDDARKQGAIINNVKVRGRTSDLPRLVDELKIDHVVISIAHAPRGDFRRILDICASVPVKARVIPALHDILRGTVSISRIRDVQIEDLLGREPVQLDETDIGRFLANKVVMVTGAGGSIGSELAQQVARFGPERLLLVERAEFALFNVERELRAAHSRLALVPLVADVGDEPLMRSIFHSHRPHIVLHAAAHKHVPMMEANPIAAVKNNTLATRLLGELAGEFAAEAFVLISTDKAVWPTSVMGASKRVAELVVQDLDRRHRTRYVAVRFGNVIGSAGSVIPIFREQIRKGGPVTVTHPDMVRYFMTIPEAAQLVLQAGAMGEGGEIFILDMGEPVSILDLAKETIRLSGLKPFEDIDIVFTGLRPGEKLFEELETMEERVTKTRHPKIFIGKIAPYSEERMRHALFRLTILAKGGYEQELYKFLNELLPEARLKVAAHANSPHIKLLRRAAGGGARA